MEKAILVAIIGSITTFLAPILTLLIKKKLDDKAKPIPSVNNKSIEGKWSGNTCQKLHSHDVEFKITFLFKFEQNKLSGACVVNVSETNNINLETFVINGGLFKERFLKIEYNNNDPKIMQFGYFLLELSPLGNKLDGKFVGYGPESKEVICGKVALEKEN